MVIEIKQHQSKNEYLNKIRLYLKDVINNLRKSDTWKIQFTIANESLSSLDNVVERVKVIT